ncbi:hypothetical protein CRUP_000474 [Coryphaenoides rupestris]|nr:hypothetical protein CRUP_000474 [Coryphaenoides rupestris]
MANVAADPPNPPGAKGSPRDAPVAAASQPRRTTGGWKLAEEQACREDLSRLCPKHTWNNNLAVLECLQDRKEIKNKLPFFLDMVSRFALWLYSVSSLHH